MPKLPLLVAAVLLIISIATSAATADPTRSILFEQLRLEQVGGTTKSLRDALLGPEPETTEVQADAHHLNLLAAHVPRWYRRSANAKLAGTCKSCRHQFRW